MEKERVQINCYNNFSLCADASQYINQNRKNCYLGSKGDTNYYNVKGIVWEIWQEGLGHYPKSYNEKVENFNIDIK